jgi:hypothetical protein
MAGSHNGINMLHRSPVFDRLLKGTALVVNYEINGNAYDMTYYIVDGICPDWPTLVKTCRKPDTWKIKRVA